MRNARVIVTFKCVRSCSYCCNKHANIRSELRELGGMQDLDGCEEIMVTGGEPTLVPQVTESLIIDIRNHHPQAKLYLYSARHTQKIDFLVRRGLVDGVTYTVHDWATAKEITDFEYMQELASKRKCKGMSFRLHIGPRINRAVPIRTRAWSEIRMKQWKMPGECRVPEGELLFFVGSGSVFRRIDGNA